MVDEQGKSEQDKYYVSWDQWYMTCRMLSMAVKEKFGVPDHIVAITRGGLFVAGVLSYELQVRSISTLCLERYNDEHMWNTRDVSLPPKQLYDKPKYTPTDNQGRVLIVDDVCDLGVSMIHAKEHIVAPELFMVAPYAKPRGSKWIHLWTTIVPQHSWIVFPWDKR